MSIDVQKVSKKFNQSWVLKEASLTVETGELVALLGPSGSGKTTLLRVIAGLEYADTGDILFSGANANHVRVQDRQVGFVFQHYALFRHMTVFENIAFGLRVRPRAHRLKEEEIVRRVTELLQLIQLEQFSKQCPSQLSGGQRQRVALARALAIEPKVLLLDEPFGALDAKVRKELCKWLRRLHQDLHTTSLFVTHDVQEALELADRIVVMKSGEIQQIGTPDEVYHHPANAFVYQFIGHVNLFKTQFEEGGRGLFRSGSTTYVRPYLLDIHRENKGHTDAFKATVKQIIYTGLLAKIELLTEYEEYIEVELTRERCMVLKLQKEETVYVSLKEGATDDYAI